MVDGASDYPDPLNPANPAWAYGACFNGIGYVGWMPILGLLPGAAVTDVHPRLRAFGEGVLGRSLEVQFDRVIPDANLLAGVLVHDTEQAGNGSPCLQFVAPGASSFFVPIDGFGFGRVTINLPTSPAYLHARLMLQGALVYPPPQPLLLTNGLRVTIGGGL